MAMCPLPRFDVELQSGAIPGYLFFAESLIWDFFVGHLLTTLFSDCFSPLNGHHGVTFLFHEKNLNYFSVEKKKKT